MKRFLALILAAVMTAVMIPAANAEVDQNLFGHFMCNIENGEVIIVYLVQFTDGSLKIPDTLGGYPVTGIGNGFLRRDERISYVTIPTSVTSIGDYAFYECRELVDIYYAGGQEDWEKITVGENDFENYFIHYNVSDATGHYEKVTEVTDCTAPVKTAYTCPCGHSKNVDFLPPTGHLNTEVIGAVEATCAEEGYTGDKYCRDCETTVEYGSVIPAEEHTPPENGGETVAPTCTEDGYTEYTCEVCELSVKTDHTPATGHRNTQRLNYKAATCTAEGYTGDTYCRDCDKTVIYGEAVSPVPHSLINHPAKSPTCTEIGWFAYDTCANCDYTTYVELRTYDHSYENGVCTHCGTAAPPVPGDVSGDYRINLADVSLILKYIAGWDVTIDTDIADVTDDGKVNLADVSLILKYIADWDVTLA